MLIELEPGVSFYACAVATLDQTVTLSLAVLFAVLGSIAICWHGHVCCSNL